MIEYISAYDLQQERRWTRDYVIKLAEKGPVYWKANEKELIDNDGKITYYPDGFTEFKGRVMKMWKDAAARMKSDQKILHWLVHETTEGDFDNLDRVSQALNNFLLEKNEGDGQQSETYTVFTDYIDDLPRGNNDQRMGEKREEMMSFMDEYEALHESPKGLCIRQRQKTSASYYRSIFASLVPKELVETMSFGNFCTLLKITEKAKTDDVIWNYLQGSPNPFNISMFEFIFKNLLFFDQNNLPNAGAQGEKARLTDTAEITANNDELISALTELSCLKRVPKQREGEPTQTHVDRIIKEHQKAKNVIDELILKGHDRETIANKLKEIGWGIAFIGCLVNETKPSSIQGARDAAKRLLGQKK